MKYLIVIIVGIVSCTSNTNKKVSNPYQYELDEGEHFATYIEGTVKPFGRGKLNNKSFILHNNIDIISEATKLFQSIQPLTNNTHILSTDTLTLFFTGSTTNEVQTPYYPIPEYTIKLLIRDDGEVEFAEWEHVYIDYNNSRYHGTHRITAKDGLWNPNHSYSGIPGNNSEAQGTVKWNKHSKVITFIAKFIGTNQQLYTVESSFRLQQIFREHPVIIPNTYKSYNQFYSLPIFSLN